MTRKEKVDAIIGFGILLVIGFVCYQIFGGDEEAMALSAKIVETVQPDLVDINFGCPVKKVVCKGAGAGILREIDKMQSIQEHQR